MSVTLSSEGKLHITDRVRAGNELRILLADDNVTNQFISIKILNKIGLHPELAENGKQVLQMAKTTPFDLILMDVRMPEMDGLEVTAILRKELTIQPVIIAVTANATEGDDLECLRAGMDDYLSKPIRLQDIKITLKKWEKKLKDLNGNFKGCSWETE